MQAHADCGEAKQAADLRTTTLKGRNWLEVAAPASARGCAEEPKRWGWGQASMRVSMALVRGEVTHKASSGIFCSANLVRSLEACRLAPGLVGSHCNMSHNTACPKLQSHNALTGLTCAANGGWLVLITCHRHLESVCTDGCMQLEARDAVAAILLSSYHVGKQSDIQQCGAAIGRDQAKTGLT